jgi:predicted lipoprotein with Yx(FWY)xxD motif
MAIGIATGALAAAAILPVAASASAAPRAKSALMVKVASNANLGKILVTTSGMTLYRYTLDKAGKVACTGKCAVAWPPLLLPSGVTTPTGGPGVTGLGTVKDPDGKLQVTDHGEPLYRFVGDKKAGNTNGQGLGGTWFVVSAKSAKTTSSSSTSGSGYGY